MNKKLKYSSLKCVLSLVLLGLLWACSKEDAPPKLQVLNPASNVFISTNEQLELKVSCSDDIGLKSLQVFIKNEELSTIYTSVSQLLNGETSKEVTLIFDFSEILLPGGKYMFHFSLRDEEQASSAFVPFTYQGTPRKLTHTVLLNKENGGNKLKVYTDSSAFTVWQNHPERELNLDVSTAAQGYALQAVYEEGLQVFNAQQQSVFTVPIYRQFPERSFNHVSFYNDKIWLAFDDGRLVNYSAQGTSLRQITLPSGFSPYFVKQIEDRLFVYAKDLVNGKEKLYVFLASSGGALGERELFTDGFTGLFANGKNQYLIVYQKGADVKISDLLYPSMGGLVVESIFNADVRAAVKEDLLWIATDQGLFSFHHASNNLLQRSTSLYQNIWLDQRAEQLWLCKGNEVEMRNVDNLQLEGQRVESTADTIVSAVAMYNY